MTRFVACAVAALIGAGAALAQNGQPGAHFIENWDLNADGAVTRAEANEKRADLFTMFDEDGSGSLDGAEYDLFDRTRLSDMAENADGHGKGPMRVVNEGMTLEFNDVDNDGVVRRDEFLGRNSSWFDMIDRTGDGVVNSADFAPGD